MSVQTFVAMLARDAHVARRNAITLTFQTLLQPMLFVFVFGRSHHAVSIYGANVFVEMVRLGLEREGVRELVSGKFVMEVVEDAQGDSELLLDVELARGVAPDVVDVAALARAIREEVVAASGEYRSYVPPFRQTPHVRVWPYAHPEHFPVGVKHRYVRSG